MRKFLAVALMLAAVGCRSETGATTETARKEAREFVCYTDGVLTERHIGVDSAAAWHEDGGLYRLEYTDGQTMTYLPQRGETCGVETVNL